MIHIAARRAARSAADGPARDGLATLHTAAAELARVLCGMALLGNGPAPPDDAAGAWADDDYLYVEVRLSDDLGPCIDVSTCGRTLMVRIARGVDRESLAAMPSGDAADPSGNLAVGPRGKPPILARVEP